MGWNVWIPQNSSTASILILQLDHTRLTFFNCEFRHDVPQSVIHTRADGCGIIADGCWLMANDLVLFACHDASYNSAGTILLWWHFNCLTCICRVEIFMMITNLRLVAHKFSVPMVRAGLSSQVRTHTTPKHPHTLLYIHNNYYRLSPPFHMSNITSL